MELLKSNIIINPDYKPSKRLNYLEYFNRALVFAQTNYHNEIEKVMRTQFPKLSPSRFFEEYTWCINMAANDPYKAAEIFPELSKAITPYCHSFWDLNNFPKSEDTKEKLTALLGNERKFDSIHNCADIINRGIKLFGWDKYRDNFLNSPEKLVVLPGLGLSRAKQLSRNIGASQDIISSTRLHDLATHWHFRDTLEMCKEIQLKIAMPLKIIELVFWYAASTFEDKENVSEA